MALPFVLSGCSSFGVYNPATLAVLFILTQQTEVSMGQEIHGTDSPRDAAVHKINHITQLERVGQVLGMFLTEQDYLYHFYVLNKG